MSHINKSNKGEELTIIQRIIAVLIYVSVFLFICRWFSESWSYLIDSNSHYNLLFISGALLLIFGAYIAEPYFTKPVDVITNSTAVILALLSVKDQSSFVGYWFLFYSALIIGLGSVLLIFTSQFPKVEKMQKMFFEIITKIGQSKVFFSAIYLLTIYSYFSERRFELAVFLTFWILFITRFLVEKLILWVSKMCNFIKSEDKILGEAIGCQNPFLYKVEIDFLKHKNKDVKKGELVYLSLEKGQGAIGIVINEKQLLNKKWITVYFLEDNGYPLKLDFKKKNFISSSKTIFSKDNSVYLFDLNEIKENEERVKVESNYLYKNRDNFIGYITDGSDINKIKFNSLIDNSKYKYKLLREGTVIKTNIYDTEVLYQIIDGKTNEEELEKHNIYGYLTGIAQKLGKYDKVKKELKVVKWLPNIYSPVFFDDTEAGAPDDLAIGKLPETKLEIILKDPDSLITHNTAILGILGIGKSCLTFELIKKIVNKTTAKIICIDITNEYIKNLINYFDGDLIQNDLGQDILKSIKDNSKDGNPDNPTSWGNEDFYKETLSEEFKKFAKTDSKRVLILNPDWHSVTKAGSQYKIQHKVDLTVSEKTRIISERLFILARSEWDQLKDEDRQNNKARYLIVFEESHSLIPEWNSASNEGDKNASNGTAKIILQGRKYGLGSFVVTQRTANISKSILNQCNTIFALRVFDDTGKQFLENYIGSDYSNTLPTLEERHAIAVGKALQLKQPVIIRLNDIKDIAKNNPSSI